MLDPQTLWDKNLTNVLYVEKHSRSNISFATSGTTREIKISLQIDDGLQKILGPDLINIKKMLIFLKLTKLYNLNTNQSQFQKPP